MQDFIVLNIFIIPKHFEIVNKNLDVSHHFFFGSLPDPLYGWCWMSCGIADHKSSFSGNNRQLGFIQNYSWTLWKMINKTKMKWNEITHDWNCRTF